MSEKTKIVNSIQRTVLVERMANPFNMRHWQRMGIVPYDKDNLYPNKAKTFYQRSGTTMAASNVYRDFVAGEGFEGYNDFEVNEEGLTLLDILVHCADEKSVFNGFALHFNYNRLGQITEINEILFENLRKLVDGKIVSNPNWARYQKQNNTEYYAYNPDTVIEEINKDGIENYNGQVLYWIPKGCEFYSLAMFDSVFDDSQFEAESKLYKLSNVQNRYSSEFAFKYPGNLDGNKEIEEIKAELKSASGSNNAGKTIILPIQPDVDGKFNPGNVFEEIPRTGIDKLFTSQNKETRDNIYACYKQPKILSGVSKDGGFSKDEYIDSFDYYNSIVQMDRYLIERVLNRVLENSVFNLPELEIKPKDFQIHRSSVSAGENNEGGASGAKEQAQATLKGSVGGVQGILSIQEKVSTGVTQYDSGVKILMEIFGFDEETAKKILGNPVDQKPTEKKIGK